MYIPVLQTITNLCWGKVPILSCTLYLCRVPNLNILCLFYAYTLYLYRFPNLKMLYLYYAKYTVPVQVT
jgi:hypothetical protein